VGVAGGAALSIQHIAQLADDRTFNVPDGNTADRATVQVAEVDPLNPNPFSHTSAWKNVSAFQNNYGNTGVLSFFINCIFDSYDDFYDAADALGTTPGFNPSAVNPQGVTYNADNVSSEDDYFDPNDPQRLYGPSSSCFPQFAFASIGDYTSTNPADNGKAFTLGATGSFGTGVWVNSIFSLDSYGGKTIKVRFVLTGIELGSPNSFPRWDSVFGNALGNAFRGWNIDDVAMAGLVSTPLTLVVDPRLGLTSDCPLDQSCTTTPEVSCQTVADCPITLPPNSCAPDPTPGNQAACTTMTADAGPDGATAVTGALVTLDAANSFADACVDGFLEFRWRVGGTILQDFSTNSELVDTPAGTTVYTVDVRCSSDPGCSGSDSAFVIVAVPNEASPPVQGLLMKVVPNVPAGFPAAPLGGQVVDIKVCYMATTKPNHGDFVEAIVFDLDHNGNVMRSALVGPGFSGCDDTKAAIKAALFGSGMQHMGTASDTLPNTCTPPYTLATYTDGPLPATTMHVGTDCGPDTICGNANAADDRNEVVGYLMQDDVKNLISLTITKGNLGDGRRCAQQPPGLPNRGSATMSLLPGPPPTP
jgi:hypothetical protein